MTPTNPWRFADISSDVQDFHDAVMALAQQLAGQDPSLDARAARMAARERLLVNGQRYVSLIVRSA